MYVNVLCGIAILLLFVSLKNVGVEDLETPKMHFGAFAYWGAVLVRAFLVESLSHCQCASSDSITHSLRSVEFAIARSAVYTAIGSVVQVGRVQILSALHAVEAQLVPDIVFALHLLCCENHKSAPGTSVLRLLSVAINESPTEKNRERKLR